MSLEYTGKVLQVKAEETFGSGFNKQSFVVSDPEEKYPQEVQFDCIKDNVKMLNEIRTGDKVTVKFNIRGREWNGKHFVNLEAWKVSRLGEARKSSPPVDDRQEEFTPDDTLDEDVPF